MPRKGYKQSEEHKRKAAEPKKGMIPWNKGLKGMIPWNKGKIGVYNHSKESKRKISKSNKISQLGNQNAFKYGHDGYWHNEAWKLFGEYKCLKCGMTNEEHIKEFGCRLNMHCTSEPKDYTLMEESNWDTYCKRCHGRIDNGN